MLVSLLGSNSGSGVALPLTDFRSRLMVRTNDVLQMAAVFRLAWRDMFRWKEVWSSNPEWLSCEGQGRCDFVQGPRGVGGC